MTPEKLLQLYNEGYNRIPVCRVVAADLDTPLSIYMKATVDEVRGTFLFESMQGGERWGRYSIVGLASGKRIEVRGHTVSELTDDKVTETHEVDDPLVWIENFMQSISFPDLPNVPRITGGLVGYFSYDTVRHIEPRLGANQAADPIDTPDMLFLVCDELIVFDNISATATLIVIASPADEQACGASYTSAQQRLDEIHGKLLDPLANSAPDKKNNSGRITKETDFVSGFTEEGYKEAVNKVKEYIVAGDCMQVVLSQRLSTPFESSPLDLYRALRRLNPSPYMFYIHAGDHQIVGSSPEILVRCEDNEIVLRPIAGTRPRGKTLAEDQALEQELLADPKELAEHLMLIDLGRNDVGRVAKTGTVKVTDKMTIERYSHVMHIVSNVVGQLKPDMSSLSVLRATFPAGTLSGAPKVRAMEIIQELEPIKRGIYSGAIGYLSWNGAMDTCIAIRTAVIKDDTLYVQAGAGIVHDSDPQAEWDESMAKARAIFRAVEAIESEQSGTHSFGESTGAEERS